MSIRFILWGLLASSLLATNVSADMGRVHVAGEDVHVSEDAQKAIILYNLHEEVLILGTELKANRKTPIIRFIPFPSEPEVSLAPAGVFDRLAAIVAKYRLQFLHMHYSKGGAATTNAEGVEVRLSARLGAHDFTVIKVRDAAAFRSWVNNYFRGKQLPLRESYPKEEAIVADYVARGIDFFALDYVEVAQDKHFIDPVIYRFKSKELYYPLKTSNSFGGKGAIELFIIAPTTLCAPGSNIFMMQDYDRALDAQGRLAGKCLNIEAKASTSAMLVPEEQDLRGIYPDGAAFFGQQPVFIQSIHYYGNYDFKDDIIVPVSQGVRKAWGPIRFEENQTNSRFPELDKILNGSSDCRLKPDTGPCKGRFEAYFFDEKTRSCKPFFWGGCQGVVPFETREKCEADCKALKAERNDK